MSVEITPKGTYGAKMPRLPGPLLKIFTALNVAFFRVLGKRMRIWGRPLLLLTTVGAKTGRVHETPLAWFDDVEGTWLIVASRAGTPGHPAWFHNLAGHPDQVWIEVGGRKVRVQPETLSGEERERAWQHVVSRAPGYGGYQKKTDRVIPLIRLRPGG
jgi:deazaflavin-dependent oxidoreductase (nitroreductase family)